MRNDHGFTGVFDQSGGSTFETLKAYGIAEDTWKNKDEMLDLIHQIRTRTTKNPTFAIGKLVGVVLFERTIRGQIDGTNTTDYLWGKLSIILFLKMDKEL